MDLTAFAVRLLHPWWRIDFRIRFAIFTLVQVVIFAAVFTLVAIGSPSLKSWAVPVGVLLALLVALADAISEAIERHTRARGDRSA